LFFFFFSSGSSSATRQVSHGKHSEDDDMAYFEKCYQEWASYYIYCLIQIYFHNRMSKKDKCMIYGAYKCIISFVLFTLAS